MHKKYVCVHAENSTNSVATNPVFLKNSRSISLCDLVCVLCSTTSTTTTSTFTWDCVCMCGTVGRYMHIFMGGWV